MLYIGIIQKRNTTRNKIDRKVKKENYISNMHSTLASLYDGLSRNNTSIMELTVRQRNRLQDNIIHLSNIRRCPINNHTYYDRISFGKSVFTNKKEKKIGGNKKNRYFNLRKTKGGFIMITANKNECLGMVPNTHSYGTVMSYKPKSNYDLSPPMSGVVILMIAIIDDFKEDEERNYIWDNEIHSITKKCKENSLKSYDHHGTSGYAYSFGNKPLYGNKDGSSVGIYSNKKSKDESKQYSINSKATMLESICSASIKQGIKCVSKIIPEIRELLCPIINAAYQKHCDANINLLKKGDNFDDSLWNCFMFVDGKTDNFHTENDCAYTFITVS